MYKYIFVFMFFLGHASVTSCLWSVFVFNMCFISLKKNFSPLSTVLSPFVTKMYKKKKKRWSIYLLMVLLSTLRHTQVIQLYTGLRKKAPSSV